MYAGGFSKVDRLHSGMVDVFPGLQIAALDLRRAVRGQVGLRTGVAHELSGETIPVVSSEEHRMPGPTAECRLHERTIRLRATARGVSDAAHRLDAQRGDVDERDQRPIDGVARGSRQSIQAAAQRGRHSMAPEFGSLNVQPWLAGKGGGDELFDLGGAGSHDYDHRRASGIEQYACAAHSPGIACRAIDPLCADQCLRAPHAAAASRCEKQAGGLWIVTHPIIVGALKSP